MQNVFSNSDHAQPEKLVIQKASDTIARTTQKSCRRFLRKAVEEKDIIVVPEALADPSRNEKGFVPRSTGNENINTPQNGSENKDEGDAHPKRRKHFDGKQAALLSSTTKQ